MTKTARYQEEYAGFSPNASDCIACGKCNEWCDYHLKVPEMMTVAHCELAK